MGAALVSLLVIALDQATKWWAAGRGCVTLNTGVSFGWLEFSPVVFTVVWFGVLAFFGSWVRGKNVSGWARGLFFGGAISNLLDRWVVGGVQDWLPVPVLELKNNLADYALIISLLYILIVELRQQTHDTN